MLFEDTIFGSYDKGEHKARKAFELYEDGNISEALLWMMLCDWISLNVFIKRVFSSSVIFILKT